MKIKIDSDKFFWEHKNGLLRDETKKLCDRIMLEGMDSVLKGGDGSVYILQEELDLVYACEKDYETEEAESNEVSTLRLKGMAEDKNGNIEDAVKCYELCIWKGEHADHDLFSQYSYAYQRIFVALRKLERYEDERKYLENYLTYVDRLSAYEKETYAKRLTSVTKRLGKQS